MRCLSNVKGVTNYLAVVERDPSAHKPRGGPRSRSQRRSGLRVLDSTRGTRSSGLYPMWCSISFHTLASRLHTWTSHDALTCQRVRQPCRCRSAPRRLSDTACPVVPETAWGILARAAGCCARATPLGRRRIPRVKATGAGEQRVNSADAAVQAWKDTGKVLCPVATQAPASWLTSDSRIHVQQPANDASIRLRRLRALARGTSAIHTATATRADGRLSVRD